MRFSARSPLSLVLTLAAALLFPALAPAQEESFSDVDAPAEGEQPQQHPLLVQGESELRSGEYEKALQTFQKLAIEAQQQGGLEGMQNQALAMVGMARAQAGAGELQSALEDLNSILSQEPEFAAALIARGLVNLEMNSIEAYEEALTDFETVVRQPGQRGNLEVQFGLGKAYTLLGRYAEALKPLSRVIAADPQNAEALRLRGTAYGWLYKTKEALADLEQAESINPADYEIYLNRGIVYLRGKEYEKAAEQFGKSIEHYKPEPGQEDMPFVQGHLTRASAFIEHGKSLTDENARRAAYQAALEESNKVLEQLDENNPYHATSRAATLQSRGIAERMLGELASAIRTFSQIIEINPPSVELLAEAYFRRGICFHLIGEDKMAISDFSTAASLSLNDPRASLWEGVTHAKSGDYYEALRAYGNAIAASDRYTPAFVNRGLAYLAIGDNEQAVEDFNDAIRLEPTNGDHYFNRGIAYERLGETEKASESFASAIEFDNQNAGAYRHLADALEALGRGELASEYRERAEELPRPETTN